MTLFIIMSAALAGPLADGYKGLKWGKYKNFPAPTDKCRKGSDSGIEWICDQSIGTVPVEAAYAYRYGIFYAVAIIGKDFLTCTTLMNTFEAGWGESLPQSKFATDKLDNRAWRDGDVFASWKYDSYYKECTVYMIHNTFMGSVENAEKAAAAKGAQDL